MRSAAFTALLFVVSLSSPAEEAGRVAARPGETVYVELTRPGAVSVSPPLSRGDIKVAVSGNLRIVTFMSEQAGRYTLIAGEEAFAVIDVRGIGFREAAWLLGGLFLFLFGMHEASGALRKAAGGTLRIVLHKVTSNRLIGVGIGVLLSVALQSSSAATVMLVGLASAGLLGLSQAVPVVLGTALGTTVTVQIIAFDLSDYALYLVAAGALIVLVSPYKHWSYLGRVLLGFGLLFLGMVFMKNGVAPLRAYPPLIHFLTTMSRYPVVGVIASAAVTGVIQSSAATIALAMTLASAGLLDFGGAMAIVLGANIGTTVTALLSCIGTSRTAVRIAVVHFLYKVLAVCLMLPLVWVLREHQSYFELGGGIERAIANYHLGVNLVWVGLALPFTHYLAALTRIIVRGEEEHPSEGRLHQGLLENPASAVEEAAREAGRIAGLVRKQVEQLLPALLDYSGIELERLEASDEEVDRAHRRSIEFLRRLALRGMGDKIVYEVASLIYVLRDLEAIGDLVSKDVVRIGYKRLRKDKVIALGDLAALKRGVSKVQRHLQEMEEVLSQGISGIPLKDKKKRARLQEIVEELENGETEFLEVHAEHFRKLQQDVTEAVESDSIFVDFVSILRQICYVTGDAAAALVRSPEEAGFFHHRERKRERSK